MTNILPDVDFKTVKNDTNFKEDSVREVVIVPLLKQLGYQQENIKRSKILKHPFLKVGSKKRKIDLIPDEESNRHTQKSMVEKVLAMGTMPASHACRVSAPWSSKIFAMAGVSAKNSDVR